MSVSATVHLVRTCRLRRGPVGPRDDGRAGVGLQSWGRHPGAGCPGERLVVGAGGRAAGLVPLQLCESK